MILLKKTEVINWNLKYIKLYVQILKSFGQSTV